MTMAAIKSYTDISQSKTLSKILPIESADMYYQYVLPKSGKIKHNPEIGNPINALKWYNKGYTTSGKEPITLDEFCVPCWSLAALLGVLPYGYSSILTKSFNGKDYYCEIDGKTFETEADNPVDACYEIILKLHELKML